MTNEQPISALHTLERISEMLVGRFATPESALVAIVVAVFLLLFTSAALTFLRKAFARLVGIRIAVKRRQTKTKVLGRPTIPSAVALLSGFVALTPPVLGSAQTAPAITEEDVPSMRLIETLEYANPTPRPSNPIDSAPAPSSLPQSNEESNVRPPTHSNLLPEIGIDVAAPAPFFPPEYWTVEAGDCLWNIATAVRTQQLSRLATGSEILEYLNRVIDANRHVLVDPERPDLIYSGQKFLLPKA